MRRELKDFDDLEVYQLANGLTDWLYDLTAGFPGDEKYNIISHLREAGCSVGANIAEGFGRFHYKENIQFCRIARGSLSEVKHFMLFSMRRGYISESVFEEFSRKHAVLRIKLNNYIRSIGPV
jgi:four helix bundle protein